MCAPKRVSMCRSRASEKVPTHRSRDTRLPRSAFQLRARKVRLAGLQIDSSRRARQSGWRGPRAAGRSRRTCPSVGRHRQWVSGAFPTASPLRPRTCASSSSAYVHAAPPAAPCTVAGLMTASTTCAVVSCLNGSFSVVVRASSSSGCSAYSWPACCSAKARSAASDSPSCGTAGCRRSSLCRSRLKPTAHRSASAVAASSAIIARRRAPRSYSNPSSGTEAASAPLREKAKLRSSAFSRSGRGGHDRAARAAQCLVASCGRTPFGERARALLPPASCHVTFLRATARRSARLSGPRVAHAPAACTATRARRLLAQQPAVRPLAGHWLFPPPWLGSQRASLTTASCG